MCSAEKLLIILIADDESDGEADGAPKAVTAADPVPELEHVFSGDTEGGDGLGVGAKGNEMFGNVGLILCRSQEPFAGTGGVCDGLLGCESLASDDEECGLGMAETKSLSQVGSIDVGHEVGVEVALCISFEGFGDHDGTEIGATYADIDDGVDILACVTLPGPTADGV